MAIWSKWAAAQLVALHQQPQDIVGTEHGPDGGGRSTHQAQRRIKSAPKTVLAENGAAFAQRAAGKIVKRERNDGKRVASRAIRPSRCRDTSSADDLPGGLLIGRVSWRGQYAE